MKGIIHLVASVSGVICMFISFSVKAQTSWSTPATVGSRSELVLLYSYQWVTAGRGHQDLKIICKNITTDKIKFKINYEVHFYNGDVEHVSSENTIELRPGETFDPQSVMDWGGVYMRFFLTPTGGKYGAKEKWFQFGKDRNDTPLYSAIHSVVKMQITDFINISRKEREEKGKLEKEPKEGSTKSQQSILTKSTANDDFWSDSGTGSSSDRVSNSEVKQDENIKSASQFKGGLDDIKEGEYFADDKGNHYQKVRGSAHKVDKASYDRYAANKIYKKMARQEAERQQRDAEFKQNWDNVSTSFYMMSAAKEGLRDASYLGGNFETIEELNAAFRQQMREISVMASELQQSSTQGAQAYAQMIGTGSSGYDYSGYANAIGGIAAAIGANKAEKEAREELKRQRDEAEAQIKARQLKALVAVRTEIDKVFTEGGMPLSSHRVTAPVLYMFAYSSNKTDWNKNQPVALGISNVIPVYRYSDGTYPYTSDVKRTFESAGMSNPIIIGYFTDQEEAEGYRSSLLDVAPEANFAVQDVEVEVKERAINTQDDTSSGVDFWGTKSSGGTGSKSAPTNAKEKEVDFWGMPVKDNATNKKNLSTKKAEPNKEKQKEVDFWGK